MDNTLHNDMWPGRYGETTNAIRCHTKIQSLMTKSTFSMAVKTRLILS